MSDNISKSYSSPKLILTPKSLFIKERLESYNDWLFATWRELFQNSVDAGSRNIDIKILKTSGKGVFNRDPNLDSVFRIIFDDDGHGMDSNIINNVFFKIGETSKKNNDTTGGFGTARNMLCFSHDRYSIKTGDLYVEGDGLEYNIYKIDELIKDKESLLLKARQDQNSHLINKLGNELIDLNSLKLYKKGCIFEIDINPNDKIDYWNFVSVENLKSSLIDYLSYSNLESKVKINGDLYKSKHYKGAVKRVLMFKDEKGNQLQLGNIYVSSGDTSKHKGKVIIRVNGSAMFYEHTSAPQQVIVEINKEFSRVALNDKRDGLKGFVKQALNSFLEDLVVNNQSALQEKSKIKNLEFKGGLGTKTNYRQQYVNDIIQYDQNFNEEFIKLPKSSFSIYEDYIQYGDQKIAKEVFIKLTDAVVNDKKTIIDNILLTSELLDAKNLIKSNILNSNSNLEFLKNTTEVFQNELASLLVNKINKGDSGLLITDNMKNLHDIHVHIDDLGNNNKVKSAVKRYLPDYWILGNEEASTRGIEGYKLLTWYTTAVDQAVHLLYEMYPVYYSKKPLSYTTGFNFDNEKQVWSSVSGYSMVNNRALHKQKDGLHIFLINPVHNDGTFLYDLKSEKTKGVKFEKYTLQDIEALALHEVAHAVSDRHDEEFANILTSLTSKFNREQFIEEGYKRIEILDITYGKKKTFIQKIKNYDSKDKSLLNDEEKNVLPKRRGRPAGSKNKLPSEWLRDMAYPAISSVFEPENFNLNPNDQIKMIETIHKLAKEDGDVTIYNNSKLSKIEDMLNFSTLTIPLRYKDELIVSGENISNESNILDEDVFMNLGDLSNVNEAQLFKIKEEKIEDIFNIQELEVKGFQF